MARKSQQYTNPFLKAKVRSAPTGDISRSTINDAISLHQQGRLSEAKAIYELILKADPKNSDALHLLGVVAYQHQEYQVAVDLIGYSLEINPNNHEAYSNRGNALMGLKQFEAALKCFDLAINLNPNFADAHYNKANTLIELKEFEAALVSFDLTISLNPNFADAYCNRGNAMLKLKQFESALESFDLAISISPDLAEAYSNRGIALTRLMQFEAAMESLDRAFSLKPDSAEVSLNRGTTLMQLKYFAVALTNFDKAISLKPDYAEAHSIRGNALLKLNQVEAAVESFGRALSLEPDFSYLLSTILFTRMTMCDWQNYQRSKAELALKIKNNAKAATPFMLGAISDSLSALLKVALDYTQDMHPAAAQPRWSGQRYGHKKIRVAYISCDFSIHPATLNNIGVWERHDRVRFESIAISYGPVYPEDTTPQGQMRARLVKAFDQFLDVGDKSDEQIAKLVLALEVDIAVDISGTMGGGRQGIFAKRPAPVQVNLYSFTSGAPYMDYIVADRVVIPSEHEMGYTEKVVCLPDTYFSSDTSRQVSERQFSRSELGLPESGVVYCSFNGTYKINPQMFDVWMRVLLQVPGSVLWLQGNSQEKVKENLRREAQSRGVDPNRLVFAEKIDSMADHLARHRAADVFLDTLPFNAQTTAGDALWAGLPVLTCLGQSSFGRIAGSMLMALGMPELVMRDMPSYEAMAVRLGKDAGLVQQLKDKLNRQRLSSPLFDVDRLTRHMETAYEQMHKRVQQGLGPHAFGTEARDLI